MFSYPQAEYEVRPFPHAVIRGAWDEELLQDIKAEVPGTLWDGERNFHGAQKKRFCSDIDKLGIASRILTQEASGPKFLRWLEKLTGEPGLLPDPYLLGGGIHSTKRGGFLKMHVDFNWHQGLHLYRRLNVLIYLNDWQSEWGGKLELSGDSFKKISPERNTMVVFTTDDASLHGHPHPLECPEDVTRDSIALYYYSAIKPKRNFAGIRDNTGYAG